MFFSQGACRMSALPLRVGLSLLLVTFLLAAVGCGEQLANVSGEVKIKVKDKDKEVEVPLNSGMVTFESEGRKKRVKNSPLDKGRYTITGIPVGNVVITVQGSYSDPKVVDKKTK